jgi:hypothetical protein
MVSQRGGAAALLAVALLACDGERRASQGSLLAEPRMWPGGLEMWASESTLPPDALSVTLMATGPESALLSLGVRDPAGRVLVDAAAPEQSLNRLLRGHGLVIGAIPSASAALPLASNYAVTASGAADGLTVSAWVKRGLRGPAVPEVQELPIAVLLVGPAASIDRRALELALGLVGRIWRHAGIEVLEPQALAIEGPPAVEVDGALGSDSPAVGAVLRLSSRAPVGSLSLVVVGDLSIAGSSLGLWALAGSIPVPPVTGTPRSGVVVSGSLIARDPLWAGQVIAHELGHALGLYHTTERVLAGDAVHDQIADTPACPASADGDGDGVLEAAECEGQDAGNLMFWATARGASTLTPGQAALARRSALVR